MPTTSIPGQIAALRWLREQRGFSLRETAREARMDAAHLSRIERGLARPSVNALVRLGVVLNADPGFLLDPYVERREDP